MARITTTKAHTSGIPLGGIGSGSVELLPDGELHYWLIANPPRLTKRCHDNKVDDGEGSTGALSFWVRAKNHLRTSFGTVNIIIFGKTKRKPMNLL